MKSTAAPQTDGFTATGLGRKWRMTGVAASRKCDEIRGMSVSGRNVT